MGVMDKFLNYMKLNGEEDDFYEDDYYDNEYVEEKPKKLPQIKEAAPEPDDERNTPKRRHPK